MAVIEGLKSILYGSEVKISTDAPVRHHGASCNHSKLKNMTSSTVTATC
jgi:hypothetical protein